MANEKKIDPYAPDEKAISRPEHKTPIGFQHESGKILDVQGKEVKESKKSK